MLTISGIVGTLSVGTRSVGTPSVSSGTVGIVPWVEVLCVERNENVNAEGAWCNFLF